jgi:hypothetical protein
MIIWFLNWYYYLKDGVGSIWLVLSIKMKRYQNINSKELVHLAVRTNDLVQFEAVSLAQLVDHIKERFDVKFLTIVSKRHSINTEILRKLPGVEFFLNHQKYSEFGEEVKLKVNFIEEDSQRLMLNKWLLSGFSDSKISSKTRPEWKLVDSASCSFSCYRSFNIHESFDEFQILSASPS